MAGKNKMLRWARLYAGGYDLSGDARHALGSLDNSFEELDYTGWSEACRNYLSGDRRTVGIRGFQAAMNDVAGRSIDVLTQTPAVVAVTLAIGDGAAPAAADLAYLMPPVQIADRASFDAGVGILTADFPFDASQYDADYDEPWGKVLMPLTALTETTSGTSVDFAVAGATGAVASLHITATASGNYAFIIQDSATGAFAGEETTLMTFAADGSAVTSEFQTVTGAVLRYCRFQATKTAGTVSMFCALAVNGLVIV